MKSDAQKAAEEANTAKDEVLQILDEHDDEDIEMMGILDVINIWNSI